MKAKAHKKAHEYTPAMAAQAAVESFKDLLDGAGESYGFPVTYYYRGAIEEAYAELTLFTHLLQTTELKQIS